MKPEEKCVSLETAKKLKDAGFPQNTERAWLQKSTGWSLVRNDNFTGLKDDIHAAAPDAQELSSTIPFRSKKMKTVNDARFSMLKLPEDTWMCWYFDEDTDEDKTPRFIGSMQESLAMMFLYLKENNLI